MKKLTFLAIALLLIAGLAARFEFTGDDAQLQFTYYNDDLQDTREAEVAIVALPATDVTISVDQAQCAIYDAAGNYLRDETLRGDDVVEITDHFVMRELYGHTLRVNKVRQTDDLKIVVKSVEGQMQAASRLDVPASVSQAFLQVYKNTVDNFDISYLSRAEVAPSRMLIITPSGLEQYVQQLAQWKNQRGVLTEIVHLEDVGTTNVEIKNYIQNVYNTQDTPPDHLLIIGDVDMPYSFPTFLIDGNVGREMDVTDLPYTLLDGTDYFPEMIYGRISVDAPMEMMIVINKILNYEKTPYMDDPDWFERALVVAGNFSNSPPVPTTPVSVSRWLKEKFVDYGYQQVDEVYYPPTANGVVPISNALDNGVGFVTYRGWGNAHGWNYPYFHEEDVNNLNNGWKLPVMTSVVCNTGDFGNINVDPCFGEKWLRAGTTPTSPKGGVAFVGPSDLHTSTRLNNSIFAGFWTGVLDEGIREFGVAVLRGKMELYRNFPNDQGADGYVNFYFHVYNVIADPSLMMWTKTPQPITASLPASVTIGTNLITIDLPGLDGAVATAYKQDEYCNAVTVENGVAYLPLNSTTEGEVIVTITKPDYLPLETTIPITQEAEDIGVSDISPQGDVIAGTTVDVAITLQNYGTSAVSGVTANLSTDNALAVVQTTSASYGDIAAGASATQNFTIALDPQIPDNMAIIFDVEIPGFGPAKFSLHVGSLAFDVTSVVVNDANGVLDPGDTADITVTLKNIGSFDTTVDAALTAITTGAEVTQANGGNHTVAVGASFDATFTVHVFVDCYIGRSLPFDVELTSSSAQQSVARVNLTAGIIDNTAPTGHDWYGYWAYDSNDTDFDQAPVYEWHETDPENGGNGSVISLTDDDTQSIPLPFPFTYYGNEYDSLSVCSNGWVSFETTWYHDFTNWTIPCPLGPYAMIAAYWDDLKGESYMVGDSTFWHDIRVTYDYLESDNIFVIQWNDLYNRLDDVTEYAFQLVLYDPAHYPVQSGDGIIQVNYQSINNPDNENNYTTVGVENANQQDGLLYTFANIYQPGASELANNMAIRFTTEAPDGYTPAGHTTVPAALVTLQQNYPNPFNPVTTISYSIQDAGNVELIVYNVRGEKVRTLVQETMEAGTHKVVWNGIDDNENAVASGIYFYRIVTKNSSITKKSLLLK